MSTVWLEPLLLELVQRAVVLQRRDRGVDAGDQRVALLEQQAELLGIASRMPRTGRRCVEPSDLRRRDVEARSAGRR